MISSGCRMQVQEIPNQYINAVWPQVEDYIAAALEHSDNEVSLPEAKTYLIQGVWTLYGAIDSANEIHGVIAIHYFNRTDNRVAFVTAIGGKLLTNKELFSQLGDILRANGATCIEGAVRDSLVRLWSRIGARKKSNLIQIPL